VIQYNSHIMLIVIVLHAFRFIIDPGPWEIVNYLALMEVLGWLFLWVMELWIPLPQVMKEASSVSKLPMGVRPSSEFRTWRMKPGRHQNCKIMINHRLSIYTSMKHSILSLKLLALALNSLDNLSDVRIKVFTLLF
jgi:hypothetical protein